MGFISGLFGCPIHDFRALLLWETSSGSGREGQNIMWINKNVCSIMSKLQTHYHFEIDFQNVDQHTRGKKLIHSTKHCKNNQL